MAGGYLSTQGASALNSYGYSGVDHSIIANKFMKHFWNWLIDNVVPLWIAPNLLTLLGLLSVLCANFLLYVNFDGNNTPGWTYFWIGVLIFAYQTLDNLDGKQARRTGTSSALGEVFDHGADSLTIHMFALILGYTLQYGPVLTFASLLMLMIIFFLAHWEAYFTKSLVLRAVANPTESQLFVIGLLWVTALKGPAFWLQEVALPIVGLIQLNKIVFFIMLVGFVSTFADHWTTVRSFFRQRQLEFRPALLFLAPLTFLEVVTTLWLVCSPDVLYSHTRLVVTATGLLFSYLAIRAIVQTVAKEPFKIYYNVLSPLFIVLLNSIIGRLFLPIIDYEVVLYAYTLINLVITGNLIVTIVSEFCYYLNIRAFVIPTGMTTLPTIAPSAPFTNSL